MNTLFIQQELLRWFARHQRDLPWRQSYDPYQVWISEIMGQQTQMDRVAVYFRRWLERFPDIQAVAEAPEQDLLKAWEGLGYYSRVRNLAKAARQMVAGHGGRVPDTLASLRALPGIGDYTAAAILSIGFNHPIPLLDANVERLFARLADIGSPIKHKAARTQLASMAEALLDRSNPRAFNQALMEFGALVCTPKNPRCGQCPLCQDCSSLRADTVEFRPLPQKKGQRIDITMSCGIINHQGHYYIQQRLADDIWGGLWEFPGGRLKDGESPQTAAEREVFEETELHADAFEPYKTVVHHYTRYRVTLHGFLCRLKAPFVTIPTLHAATQYRWVTLEELTSFPFPAGHRLLVAALMQSKFPEKRE